MTGTDVARFTHKQSRSYLNHLVYTYWQPLSAELFVAGSKTIRKVVRSNTAKVTSELS